MKVSVKVIRGVPLGSRVIRPTNTALLIIFLSERTTDSFVQQDAQILPNNGNDLEDFRKEVLKFSQTAITCISDDGSPDFHI